MPYKTKKKCVYKKDTGKKVGCTKGPVSKYLAALYANVPDAKTENNLSTIKERNIMKKPATNMSDPSQLEKLVKLLAKKVEDFQNYVGLDAPHDAGIDTLQSEIENLKNPKITQFWKNLSSKQQGELHSMVTTYLYNKAIKADPDSFDGETPQKIVYKLSQKTKAPAGGTTGGMDKLVKYLAKESENYMNNLGLDSPEYIEFYQIEDVIDGIKNPKIKNIWNSMKSPQQEDLYDKVVAVLKKKYGSEDEYDDMLENKLNEIANKTKQKQ
jgi:hypothetical protein